jgi:hypothetical protein
MQAWSSRRNPELPASTPRHECRSCRSTDRDVIRVTGDPVFTEGGDDVGLLVAEDFPDAIDQVIGVHR